MSFATNMQAVALRLLTNYGQSISAVRDVIGAYDTATGTVTDSSDTSYSGYGYPEGYNSYQIDGTLIKQQDIKLTFSCTTQPVVNDIFTVGGVVYTAQNVERITAQGSDVVYIVQLRQ